MHGKQHCPYDLTLRKPFQLILIATCSGVRISVVRLFFSSVKESIHYSVRKMTSGRIMKNGALDVERSKYCNTNRCLQFCAEAGFSLIDSVISWILSPCEVPHEDMYFLFTWFEIIPTVMHL